MSQVGLFVCHILVSTLPLDECDINDEDDINDVILKIKKQKAVASQVRAILIKIPYPSILQWSLL
ncbi:hypothetical protein DFH08DRAFT_969264 [Mycena albidolilacea]|uniref:Uncharacterized protein n=1 Tax=Mycena albidolilacea TaxID=1033008 RepID=A0AAD7EGM2_9AGAR|nr:hypothetical protein DFH08DRAFT_969264 [Mycena albidolilacea]